ncbi:MAG TPA: universal stress protein [Alphaproteobacteria bacterium]|nr:universal stress protein [Alphaproteobacteria bacterium]
MKTILLPLEEGAALPSILQTALLAARMFGSYMEGLHVRPGLTGVVAAGAEGLVAATPGLIESFEREDQARAQRVRAAFDEFMRQHGVPWGETVEPVANPCASWYEEVAQGEATIGSRGRTFDLIVVGRPVRGGSSSAMSTLEAALFESGRPLLIAPPTPPQKLGEKIMIAWNCSSETARTLAFGMPFLNRAKEVFILTVEGGTVPGPSCHEMARNLARNGIRAEAAIIKPTRRSVGESVLAEAARWGADLLIKGAYTQSRLRQMIFGGTTSHILAEATLPVLMAN